MAWSQLLADPLISPNFNEYYARIDNYQIYSFAICDQLITQQTINHNIGINIMLPIKTSRTVTVTSTQGTGFIPFPGLPDLITRGTTHKWYSRLVPLIPGQTNSSFFEIAIAYSGDDDPNRTVPRDRASGTIVNFNPSDWDLNAEVVYPDLIGGSYESPPTESAAITYGYTQEPYVGNRLPSIVNSPISITAHELTQCIAFQSFSPHGKIEQRFDNFIRDYPYNERSGNKVNYSNLINGLPAYDQRILPDSVTFIAPITGKVIYSFYRNNRLETHPRVSNSIDLIYKSIHIKQGKTYTLDLTDIVLGTLLVDNLQTEVLIRAYTKNNQLPAMFLFADNINSLMSYWEGLVPISPPLTPRLASSFTQTDPYYIPDDLVYRQDFITSAPKIRIVSANNDHWGYGSNITSQNLPAATHQLFDFDYTTLFEQLQADGSFGRYIMDSIRIIDMAAQTTAIHTALEADKYSTNLTTPGNDRVNTLGFMIEAGNRVLGLRFDDDGNINFEKEKAQFLPATLNNPDTEPDANGKKNGYNLTSFGHKGRYVPYLPTTYNADNKEEILHDVVHDIPQMFEAVLRQMDKSLGIQHGSEIRINGLDGKVQSFPNQLSLLLHLSRQIEEIRFSTAKTFNVAVVTSAEVRELFSGIGVPATNKFLTLQDTLTGHEVQLPYFGHQKNQLSILKELSTIKINLAVQNGMMLPKKSNPLFDPFKRFK
jgi:hypothetical protein